MCLCFWALCFAALFGSVAVVGCASVHLLVCCLAVLQVCCLVVVSVGFCLGFLLVFASVYKIIVPKKDNN